MHQPRLRRRGAPSGSARGARRTRRALPGILTAAAITIALAACGPATTAATSTAGTTANANLLTAPSDPSPTGDITIWDRSGDLFKVFDAAIAAFNKKYPNITVHHEAVDINAKLQNTLITGSAVPDGVFLDDALVTGYSDYLWDLSGVLKSYVPDIAKQKVDVNSVKGGMFGIPFDLDPGLLFYNETALKAVGIDATKIATYDDLLAAAKKYKAAKPDAAPIHLELEPELMVVADRETITRALVNLLVNAWKYSDGDRKISLTARTVGRRAEQGSGGVFREPRAAGAGRAVLSLSLGRDEKDRRRAAA